MIIGFVSLGALIVAIGAFTIFLFGWGGDNAKSPIGGMEESPNIRDEVGTRISGPKEATQELGERMARFEGTLSTVAAFPARVRQFSFWHRAMRRTGPGRPRERRRLAGMRAKRATP